MLSRKKVSAFKLLPTGYTIAYFIKPWINTQYYLFFLTSTSMVNENIPHDFIFFFFWLKEVGQKFKLLLAICVPVNGPFLAFAHFSITKFEDAHFVHSTQHFIVLVKVVANIKKWEYLTFLKIHIYSFSWILRLFNRGPLLAINTRNRRKAFSSSGAGRSWIPSSSPRDIFCFNSYGIYWAKQSWEYFSSAPLF